MRTVTTYHDWREAFHARALALSQQGWPQTAIAEALGVTQSAVSKWLKSAARFGPDALHSKPHPGRPPKLTESQLADLRTLLLQGAEAHGFQGDVWTSPRVATLVERQWAITLSDRQVRRVLRHLNWSYHQPERRALQRDEAAITRWLLKRWPALQRLARREARTLLFLDETGVYLLPALVRTWAPRGETPLLHAKLSKAHLSVISAVTPEGAIYYHLQQTSYESAAILRFLDQLHGMIPGNLLIIWDGASIHKSDEVCAYVQQAAAWLKIVPLPGYAPELNPDEGVGRYLKYVELKNVTALTLGALETLVLTALQHLQGHTEIIHSFFRLAGVT